MSDLVERHARIFRFGDYPRKGWSITREQFVAANGEAGEIPVGFDPINLKHYEGKVSALDGRTGTASFAVEGDEVRATVKLPAWLDEVRRELGLKISSVIGRASNVIHKIDLVDTPHIPDAVFFADEHGDVVVFEDDEPGPEDVEFCDDGKRDMAQMHHEITAACSPGLCSGRHTVGFDRETDAERGLRMLHDHSVHEGGAYCPGMDQHHGEVNMSDDIDNVEDEGAEPEVAEFAEESPREKAMRLRLERLEAELAEKDAVTFAGTITTGKDARAYPAERKAIVEGYRRAAAIDARLGDTVTFTDGKDERQGSHLDAFRASFAARPRVAVRDEKVVGFELDPEPKAASADDAAAEAAAREERRRRTQEYARARNATPSAQ